MRPNRLTRLTATGLVLLATTLFTAAVRAGEKGDRQESDAVQAEFKKLGADKPMGKDVSVARPDKAPSIVAKPKRTRPEP